LKIYISDGVAMARCAFRTLEYDDLIIPDLLRAQGNVIFDICNDNYSNYV